MRVLMVMATVMLLSGCSAAREGRQALGVRTVEEGGDDAGISDVGDRFDAGRVHLGGPDGGSEEVLPGDSGGAAPDSGQVVVEADAGRQAAPRLWWEGRWRMQFSQWSGPAHWVEYWNVAIDSRFDLDCRVARDDGVRDMPTLIGKQVDPGHCTLWPELDDDSIPYHRYEAIWDDLQHVVKVTGYQATPHFDFFTHDADRLGDVP